MRVEERLDAIEAQLAAIARAVGVPQPGNPHYGCTGYHFQDPRRYNHIEPDRFVPGPTYESPGTSIPMKVIPLPTVVCGPDVPGSFVTRVAGQLPDCDTAGLSECLHSGE